MRAVFLTAAVAVTALRFSQRNAILKKVDDFEASTIASQKSRSDLADAIVTDFEASTVAYQKSQPDGNLSAELESAERALTPRQSDHEFNENKFLDEVDREARADENAEATATATLQNESKFVSKVEAAHNLFLHAREEADGQREEADEPQTVVHKKPHVLKRIRAHTRARAHALRVDLPEVPAQQGVCDPGITVCLPCDGTDIADTSLIPRVLQSISEQTCLPSKVILAVSGISSEGSAELMGSLPDYTELFPLEINATEERQHAGLNRNRCARAADTEVVSFFDVDDFMHPRRLELLSFAFGNFHPKAVVHAYEETPKYQCEGRVQQFKSRKFGSAFNVFDGVGIYDLSMTPDADAKNSLRTPNNHGLNHAGHISVLRSVFSEVQQSDLSRGQDAKFARDILRHFGRHEDTFACLDVPLTLYCHQASIRWFGFLTKNTTTTRSS
jgi:hypothetical protein